MEAKAHWWLLQLTGRTRPGATVANSHCPGCVLHCCDWVFTVVMLRTTQIAYCRAAACSSGAVAVAALPSCSC